MSKGWICSDLLADVLKGLDQCDSRVKERLLEHAHRLKDLVRVVSNHEAHKEYADIDVFRYKGPWIRRALAKGSDQRDALKARLGHGDYGEINLCSPKSSTTCSYAMRLSWGWANRWKVLHNAVCWDNACFVPKALQDRCARFHLHHPSIRIGGDGGGLCFLAWRIVTGLLHLISSFGLKKLVWDFCEFCVLAKIFMDL